MILENKKPLFHEKVSQKLLDWKEILMKQKSFSLNIIVLKVHSNNLKFPIFFDKFL